MKLSEKVQATNVSFFWMDNFSKIYITDYNYKWSQVSWELRNLTATASFIAEIVFNEILNYGKYSLTSPLPVNDNLLWQNFFKSFKSELKEASNLTYATPLDFLKLRYLLLPCH